MEKFSIFDAHFIDNLMTKHYKMHQVAKLDVCYRLFLIEIDDYSIQIENAVIFGTTF